MLPNHDLVQRIWDCSPHGQPSIEAKGPDSWQRLPGVPNAQPHGMDLYFSPLKFQGKRSNQNAVGMGVLFADLDPVDPREIEDLPPSVAWETSPGNYQAIWFLSTHWDFYSEWADVNKRLTYHLGADKGGWMGSKLLRWPGSFNWKRKQGVFVPHGTLVMNTDREYDFPHIRDELPSIFARRPSFDETAPHPKPLPPSEQNWLLRSYWASLSLQARSMLTRERVTDRSLHIVRTANELARCGIEPEGAFHMLWVAPWNKWRTDRYMPERLWQEVLDAHARLS